MVEGKYVEYGQMKIQALEHAVVLADRLIECGERPTPGRIVEAAEAFYLFLVDT